MFVMHQKNYCLSNRQDRSRSDEEYLSPSLWMQSISLNYK